MCSAPWRLMRPWLRVAVVGPLALLATACEPSADGDAPNASVAEPASLAPEAAGAAGMAHAAYDRDGIAFSFPGDWSVVEDEVEEALGPEAPEFRFILLESGDEALIIQRYRPPIGLTLEEFAERFLTGSAEAAGPLVAMGPMQPLAAPEAGAGQSRAPEGLGAGVEQSFIVTLHGAPTRHRSRTFRLEGAGSVAYVVTQATFERWDHVARAFDLVTATLTLR